MRKMEWFPYIFVAVYASALLGFICLALYAKKRAPADSQADQKSIWGQTPEKRSRLFARGPASHVQTIYPDPALDKKASPHSEDGLRD